MRRRDARGFTLIEMMISLAVLSVVGVTFAMSMRSMASLSSSSATRADVQREGAEALERIFDELKSSGIVTVGGLDYPHLFDDGVPGLGFGAHAHAMPAGVATANDSDFGVTREIVFLLPADADGDRLPDVDGAGELEWGVDEISYVLDQAADGTVTLQRRVNGAAPVAIASNVERVAFDDAVTSGFEVPLGAIRVRIFFRARDDEGNEVRYSVEGTTRLRNG